MPAHPSHVSWPHREPHERPQWESSHGGAAPISAHPSRGWWSHRELHRRPQWLRSHCTAAPISAYPSHGSWPHREPHRRPQWWCPHAPAPLIDPKFWHTPHTVRGPIGSPTEGPSGGVRTCPRLSYTSILAHRSHGSWPHRELHRRPQWQRSHADPPSCGAPLTRFVAPNRHGLHPHVTSYA